MTLTVGCGRHWVRTETSDRIVWKKVYSKIDKNGVEPLPDGCDLKTGKITKTGYYNDYNFYEFDTIRLYVLQTDTNLNNLIQKGNIQGQFFFSPETTSNCRTRQWTNPARSDHNNWVG